MSEEEDNIEVMEELLSEVFKLAARYKDRLTPFKFCFSLVCAATVILESMKGAKESEIMDIILSAVAAGKISHKKALEFDE